MVLTMTSWLCRGRPRQFIEMCQKSRCSILFHFDVHPSGVKIPDQQINDLETTKTLVRHDFHGEWNYRLNPRDTPSDDTS